MIRCLMLIACLAPMAASAQPLGDHAMHHGHMTMMQDIGPAKPNPVHPAKSGQSAFAAIQEIVSILEADPATDWSKVDIDALRQRLVDMNNVTLSRESHRSCSRRRHSVRRDGRWLGQQFDPAHGRCARGDDERGRRMDV